MKRREAVCMTVASRTKQGQVARARFTIALKPVGANSRHSGCREQAADFFPEETEKLTKTVGNKPALGIFGSSTAEWQE